jgi:hypothetical protein
MRKISKLLLLCILPFLCGAGTVDFTGGVGNVSCANLPALTGEVTTPSGSCVTSDVRNISTTGTNFLKWDIGGDSTTESPSIGTQRNVAVSGNLKNFAVALNVAPGGGTSYAFTVRVNGVDTAITCTISGAAKTCADSVDSAAISINDLVSIKSVPSGGPATTAAVWRILNTGEAAAGVSPGTPLNSVQYNNASAFGGTADVLSDGTGLTTAWLKAKTAPSSPSAGYGEVYEDSTSLNIAFKNASGTVNHGIQTDTGAANNFLTAVADNGLISKARPTCSSLSDSGNGCTGTLPVGANPTGTVGASAVNGSATTFLRSDGAPPLAVQHTTHVCMMNVGADNAAAVLVDGDLGPQGRQCFVPYAATLKEIDVTADGGTPNVIVRKNCAGTQTDLLSSALATAAAGGIACSQTSAVTGLDGATTCSATLQNTSVAAGCWLELKSGTAGGVAKRMSIAAVYTYN